MMSDTCSLTRRQDSASSDQSGTDEWQLRWREISEVKEATKEGEERKQGLSRRWQSVIGFGLCSKGDDDEAEEEEEEEEEASGS